MPRPPPQARGPGPQALCHAHLIKDGCCWLHTPLHSLSRQRRMDDSQKIESKLHQNGGSKPVEKCAGNKAMSGKGKAAEIALLCLVMAVIWVSLALPVVIFYLPVSVSFRLLRITACRMCLCMSGGHCAWYIHASSPVLFLDSHQRVGRKKRAWYTLTAHVLDLPRTAH